VLNFNEIWTFSNKYNIFENKVFISVIIYFYILNMYEYKYYYYRCKKWVYFKLFHVFQSLSNINNIYDCDYKKWKYYDIHTMSVLLSKC